MRNYRAKQRHRVNPPLSEELFPRVGKPAAGAGVPRTGAAGGPGGRLRGVGGGVSGAAGRMRRVAIPACFSRQSSVPLAARSSLGGAVTTTADHCHGLRHTRRRALQGRSAAPSRPSPSLKLNAEAGFLPSGSPAYPTLPPHCAGMGADGQHVSALAT